MRKDMKKIVQIVLTQIAIFSFKTTLSNRCGLIKEPQIMDTQKILIPFIPEPEAGFTPEDYNQITGKRHCGFRWVRKNSTYRGIIPGPTSGSKKYSLQNLSLVISDVTLSDAMTYYVECQFDRTVNNTCVPVSTYEVELTKAIIYHMREQNTTIFSKTTSTMASATRTTTNERFVPTREKEKPDPPVSNISTITIAVCAVVIVAIVSGTVLIIVKNKRANQEGNRRLVSPDVFSSSALRICSPDAVDPDTGRVILDQAARYVDNNTLQRSPMLPQRSDNCYHDNSSPSASEYATIDEAKMILGARKSSKDGAKNIDGAQFSVKFPNINCSSITRDLSPNCAYPGQEADHGYSRVVKRQSRHSRRRSGGKSSELKYITIDHMENPDRWHGNHEEPDRSQLTKEYASIDFEKKAFVAPIRKAPSSWYKRQRRKR